MTAEAERPFLWLQSVGDVQKLLSTCNDNIGTPVADTSMRLDALHLMWEDDARQDSSSASTHGQPATRLVIRVNHESGCAMS